MRPAQSYQPALCGLATLALVGLAGCALESETTVRARLGDWVSLGATTYFSSTQECTAGEFELAIPDIKSAVFVTSSVAEGLNRLQRAQAVAFDVRGQSPTMISEFAMSNDLPVGLGVLSSGVAAKMCMDDPVKARYLKALTDPHGVLIFAPEDNALAVVDRRAKRVFYARGNV